MRGHMAMTWPMSTCATSGPCPAIWATLLRSFPRILVPEMNQGQLVTLLRSEYLVPAEALSKVTGKPFTVAELDAAIDTALEG